MFLASSEARNSSALLMSTGSTPRIGGAPVGRMLSRA
jgi:hypothetical protein